MSAASHRVLMVFSTNHSRTTWEVVFRKPPMPRPLRTMRFGDADKIRDLHSRYGEERTADVKQALEVAIGQGHGIAVLKLGDEQFKVLRQPQ